MEVTEKHHPYHLVDPSPWPFVSSMAALITTMGTVFAFHGINRWVLVVGLLMLVYSAFSWWLDVLKESNSGAHTVPVRNGLRMGMALFIASEVMFFAAFFWAFFDAALLPKAAIEFTWPPKNIKTFDPFHLPYLNTLILLLSSTTLTWAHHSLYEKNRKGVIIGLAITVALGLIFTCIQGIEYAHAAFSMKDGIYPSTFYLATGFHGLHVIIGTVFLIVCLVRAMRNQFTADHHVGFQTAAWYWHFVDVVWLFLFIWVYIWGS